MAVVARVEPVVGVLEQRDRVGCLRVGDIQEQCLL
jgi:hypothetical protein